MILDLLSFFNDSSRGHIDFELEPLPPSVYNRVLKFEKNGIVAFQSNCGRSQHGPLINNLSIIPGRHRLMFNCLKQNGDAACISHFHLQAS